MRSRILIILLVATLLAPFVARRLVGEEDAATAPAGAARLIVVTPHNQDIRREFARAFAAWHRDRHGADVVIDYRNVGGSNDIKRLLESVYNAQRIDGRLPPRERTMVDIDVLWGGGEDLFNRELKAMGVLQPLALDRAVIEAAIPVNDLGGRPLYDRDEEGVAWVGACISGFGIVYSPAIYRAVGLPAPTAWGDLARPELRGMVALADPTSSGSAAVAYVMVLQRAMADAEEALLREQPGVDRASDAYQAALERGFADGMRQLTLMAANARYITDSASQVLNDVGKGDAAAGTSIDFYGRTYQALVGTERIRYLTPVGASALNADPVAVLYGVSGEREALANRFVEFLLTPQAQRLWILRPGAPGGPTGGRALFRSPVRRDVYADRDGWIDETIDPFSEAGGFNQRGEWMATFSQLRDLWAAAWIDNREVLRRAYDGLLRLPDEAERARAIRELGTLPVRYADTFDIRARERQATDRGAFRAAERLRWSLRFRDHYRAVAARYDPSTAGRGESR